MGEEDEDRISQDSPEFREDLANKLGEVFKSHDDSMVLGFVLVTKVMDSNGDQALHLLSSLGLTPWESYGMLHFARVREEAEQHQRWNEHGEA